MALGRILREARESKGMTIAQAAEATRILYPVIEGLETEDFRKIAAPIYGRGFIKIYAEVLGLDPNPLLNDYAELQAGGGKIKTFDRPAPLLPPKPEQMVAQEAPAAEQPPVVSESERLVKEPSSTEDFFLEPEEPPVSRRRNYSFVPGSQQNQAAQQSQTPEKSWLFSRDKTKPVFSKPVQKPTGQGMHLPKIKLPSIPRFDFRIPQALREKFAGLKCPTMTPPIKKAVVGVSAAIGVMLILSGLRLAFKPTAAVTAVPVQVQTKQTPPDTHIKASRISMPDPYID